MERILIDGKDFYLNEAGLMVLTESYLKERGYCCESGCRHCPYGRYSESKTSGSVKIPDPKS